MRMIGIVTAAACVTAPATAADLPAGAYGWMSELAGACWSATYPDGTRDTQCYDSQYSRYLRGTIELVAPAASGRSPYRGDSVAFWNAERGEIAVHYWSDAGTHGVMTGRVEGERLVFSGPARDGEVPATRTIWTRAGAEGFRIVQERREGAQWRVALSLDYRRAVPARGGARRNRLRR